MIEVDIPDSVTSIERYAFAGCINLNTISIPDSVTSIGNNSFFRCKSLTEIKIPDSVISIGDHAFDECDNLTSVTYLGVTFTPCTVEKKCRKIREANEL